MGQLDSRWMHPPSTFCMLVGRLPGNTMECYMVSWPARKGYRIMRVLNRTSLSGYPTVNAQQ